MRVAALVLAAGQSERMGYNKLLAQLESGKLVIQQTIDTILGSPARPVIVVTGYYFVQLTAAIGERPVSCVLNPNYGCGMSSSLRTGLVEVPNDARAVLVALGDMPWIETETIVKLLKTHKLDRMAICRPAYLGQHGHPVLWPRRYFEEMRLLTGDIGARSLLKAYAHQVLEVAVDDPGVLLDIDTEADLRP